MATATTLEEAAAQSFDNLYALWAVGNNDLKTATSGFATLALAIFLDSDAKARPLANWSTLIAALGFRMPTLVVAIPPDRLEYGLLVTAVDYVYRICWIAARPTPQSPAISVSQQTALLAAYNASF